jgi:hypothetical protein
VRHAHADLALSWPTRRIVVWALLWSLLLSAAEFVVIAPVHSMPPLAFLAWWLTVWSLPLWCLLGCALLWLARAAERRGDWRALVLGGLAIPVVWSALQVINTAAMNTLWRDSVPISTLSDVTGIRTASWQQIAESGLPQFTYNLWVNLFFGGLLVAAYVLSVRTERTRALLREAALSRGRTEALLGELRLQALQAQIDPALLLAGLDEVRRLYRHQSERADELLEQLVDFLRAALPGLKSPQSTLQAEMQLAAAYVALRWRMPGGARWTVEQPESLPDCPFPSMLLLSMLAMAQAGASPRLSVQWVDGKLVLTVRDAGCRLDAGIEQRARLCLQALLGERARLRANESPQTQLLIELDPVPHDAPATLALPARLATTGAAT